MRKQTSNFLAMIPDLIESKIVIDNADFDEEKNAWMHDYVEDIDECKGKLSPQSRSLSRGVP